MKVKPNRRRYQIFRKIESQESCHKKEESVKKQKQRGICLNCDDPICQHGWCDKIGNKEHKKRGDDNVEKQSGN